MDFLIDHLNYWVYVILMMIGLNAMISKNNLIKKLIGMSIFQTAIMLFYVSIGVKKGAGIPILEHGHGPGHGDSPGHGADTASHTGDSAGHVAETAAAHAGDVAGHAAEINPDLYANPLPHVLMLTAIVVGVATLGVAMAVVQKVHQRYGTIEEDEILERVKR